jgi:hypothetical protein
VKKYLTVGHAYELELPYSEVCMHLLVAGKRMRVTVLDGGAAQLLGPHNSLFSAPITWAEAGIYRDVDGRPYVQSTLEAVAEIATGRAL